MNTGIIASRYAAALYKWIGDSPQSGTICSQAGVIVNALSMEKLRVRLGDDAITSSQKLSLLEASLHPETMDPNLRKFLLLVESNGRMAELRFILIAFRNLYFKKKNIHFAKVVTAGPSSEPVRDRICSVAASAVSGKIELEETRDPSLIGGIVVEVDGLRMDASVRTALATIGREYEEKNKRII